MNGCVDRSFGRLDDFLDRWVTAPDNENDPVGRVDRERDFLDLQIGAPGAVQQNEMKARRHFAGFGHPGEITARPRSPETKRLRRRAVEIPHVRRKGFVAPVETARQGRAEYAEVFLWRIDLYGGVHLQKMI